MSGKSGPSKRSRQNTDPNPNATDVHTYIAEKEEEIKDLQKANEDLKEIYLFIYLFLITRMEPFRL